MRVEQFVRYLLSPHAARVRGLRIPPGQYAARVRERLARGAEALRTKLEEHALPVLQVRGRVRGRVRVRVRVRGRVRVTVTVRVRVRVA